MTGPRAVAGLIVLCVILLSAILANSASAAGTTAFTCSKTGPGGSFKAAHCKTADAGSGEYSHVAIKNGSTTEVAVSDLNTEGAHTGAIYKSAIAGVLFEATANTVSGAGTLTNSEERGGEMVASGELVIKYSEVTDSMHNCVISGLPGGIGTVETKPLVVTTKGQGDKLQLAPKEGTVFAEIEIVGGGMCTTNGRTIKFVGSVNATPDGATLPVTHAGVTAEKTLRLESPSGPLAGITNTLTLSGRPNSEQGYIPLSFTT